MTKFPKPFWLETQEDPKENEQSNSTPLSNSSDSHNLDIDPSEEEEKSIGEMNSQERN